MITQKMKVFCLFLMQLILILVLAAVSVHYNLKIITDAQKIIAPLQNADYNVQKVQDAQPLLQEMNGIYQSYTSLVSNLITYALWLAGILFFLEGGIWIFVQSFFKEMTVRNMFRSWIKFLISAVIFLIVPIFFIYFLGTYLMNHQDTMEALFQSQILLIMLQFIVYSFLFFCFLAMVSFAFIDAYSWKQFMKHFLFAVTKNIHKSLFLFIITMIFPALIVYVLYLLMDSQLFFLQLLCVSLLFLGLTFARILWVSSLQQLLHESEVRI